MELEWKESIQISDGKYNGEIIRVVNRTEPYNYTDVFIQPDGKEIELKYGCPTMLTPNSKLGRLLTLFGSGFQKKGKVDPEKVLKGRRVEIMVINKKSKKDGKEYAEIVEDSVKPQSAEKK